MTYPLTALSRCTRDLRYSIREAVMKFATKKAAAQKVSAKKGQAKKAATKKKAPAKESAPVRASASVEAARETLQESVTSVRDAAVAALAHISPGLVQVTSAGVQP